MSHSGKQPQHVCFYSNKCRWSEAFIKAIKDTPFKHEFQFICVDGRVRELTERYRFLKKTPTLIIRGENEPRVDSDVMNWLSERQLLSQGAGQGGGPGTQEVEPWIANEMGGAFTKGFSFLGQNDTNDAPKGNFEYLNGMSAPGTRTASDMPGGGLGARGQQDKSKKEQLFDQQMERYMRERSNGMPLPPARQ